MLTMTLIPPSSREGFVVVCYFILDRASLQPWLALNPQEIRLILLPKCWDSKCVPPKPGLCLSSVHSF